jgi:methylphosphotriester-DNA--protein-cysteine methyltransferase
VTVFDYFDGSIKIKWQQRELPYRIFDKIQKVDPGEIVSNKRLGAVLNYIKEKQELNDEARSASVPSRQHLGKSSTTRIRNTAKARSEK